MPQMDGIETTKHALSLNPELKIIAPTVHGTRQYIEQGRDGGMCHHINEPFSLEILQNLLSNVSDSLKRLDLYTLCTVNFV